jgi:hypothetical protein
MGKAGYVIGIIFGVIVTLLGLMFLGMAFVMPGLSSWFTLFLSMFIFIIAAIIFFGASRAKPRK